MRSSCWRSCLLLICSPTKTQLRLPTFALYIFSNKRRVYVKNSFLFDSFRLTPEEKKKLKFPVVLEAGSKRLSRTQPFRYYKTLRKPPYTEWTLWRSYDEHVKPPRQNIDPQMNRSATKGEVPNQWRKNIRCYPFLHETTDQQTGWNYWPSSILSALSKTLENVASEHLACVYIWSVLALVIRETATCFRVRRL